MVIDLHTTEQSKRRQIGILQDTKLPQEVLAYLRAHVPLHACDALNLNGAEQGLDAIVLAFDDISRMPRLYETPLVLVGTEPQYNLAPAFTISEFVPVKPFTKDTGAGPQECVEFDAPSLEHKIGMLREKVQYVRTARRIFGQELQVDESALQDTLQDGQARSLFEAYYFFCQEFIHDQFDLVTSMPDREAAKGLRKKLGGFAWETGNYALLDDLFDHHEWIGVANAINKGLVSPFGQDLIKKAPEFLPTLVAFLAPEMKGAPIGYDVHEHSHSVIHPPGTSLYIKHSQGTQRTSTRHEALVLEKHHKYLKRVQDYLKRIQDSTGEEFLSLPPVMYMTPKSIAEKINYDVLVLGELPGEQLAHYLYAQDKRIKALPADSADRPALEAELDRVRAAVLDDVAKSTALSYSIARLEDREPDLVRHTFSKDPLVLQGRLERRFLGDAKGDADFRDMPGGVRKAMQEWQGSDKDIVPCEQTVIKHFGPVLDIIANSSPGIDTDRSAQNLLINTRRQPNLYVGNVDFETFRDDPLLQNWVQASLLLSNYNNGHQEMKDDFVYVPDKAPMFRKGEKVSWHYVSIFDFLKRFQSHLATVRKALSRNHNARYALRFSLPNPVDAAQEFYALSAFRSGFHFGYLERFRELRKQEINFVDWMQHEYIENQRKSIEELEKHLPKSRQDELREPFRLLYDASGHLHDGVVMRMQYNDH